MTAQILVVPGDHKILVGLVVLGNQPAPFHFYLGLNAISPHNLILRFGVARDSVRRVGLNNVAAPLQARLGIVSPDRLVEKTRRQRCPVEHSLLNRSVDCHWT